MENNDLSQNVPQQPPQPVQPPVQQPVPPQPYYYAPAQYPQYVPAPKKKMSAGAICGIIALCIVGVVLLVVGTYLTITVVTRLYRQQVEVEYEYEYPDDDFVYIDQSYVVVGPSGGEIVIPDQTYPDATVKPVIPSEEIWYVTAESGLLLRSGPGKDYAYIRNLPFGTQVTVLVWDGDWAYTGEGWLSGKYLSEEPVDIKPEEPDVFLSFTPPADKGVVGTWVAVHSYTDDGFHQWCRASVIRLKADGTFEHLVNSYINDSDEWYYPGGDEGEYWAGDYTFDGKTLVLHYRAAQYVEYDEGEYGEPIYLGSYWARDEHTVELSVRQDGNGRVELSGQEDIPAFGGHSGSKDTKPYLWKADDSDELWSVIGRTLDQIL